MQSLHLGANSFNRLIHAALNENNGAIFSEKCNQFMLLPFQTILSEKHFSSHLYGNI